jgi:hypothetical protein
MGFDPSAFLDTLEAEPARAPGPVANRCVLLVGMAFEPPGFLRPEIRSLSWE